jgi:hypothetical protein
MPKIYFEIPDGKKCGKILACSCLRYNGKDEWGCTLFGKDLGIDCIYPNRCDQCLEKFGGTGEK